MAGHLLLDHRLAIGLGIVQVEDEFLRLWVLRQQLLQELTNCSPVMFSFVRRRST